jgi:hypothetical protein
MHTPTKTVLFVGLDVPTGVDLPHRLIGTDDVSSAPEADAVVLAPDTHLADQLREAHRHHQRATRCVLQPPGRPFPSLAGPLAHHVQTLPETAVRWQSLLDTCLGGEGLVQPPPELDEASLPALSASVQGLLVLLESGAAMQTVAEAIERDPALTASVLALANSAYYGLPRRVSSVSEAATHLGGTTLRLAILTCQVFAVLHSHLGRTLQQRAAMRLAIARKLGPISDEAATATLLFDVGTLLLQTLQPSHVKATRTLSRRAQRLEDTEVFQLDRDLLGAALLARWRLPNAVVHAIAHGRTPFPHPSQGLTPRTVVWASNELLNRRPLCTEWVRSMGLQRAIAHLKG